MNKDNELVIITGDKEEKATILFTFDEAGINYVVFEFDETKEISAARFEPTNDDGIGKLLDIESDEEWELVERIFDQYEKDLENEDLDD
ncbi:MAG: DUF1292 domain-containing protein [Acholeplasma sp.]